MLSLHLFSCMMRCTVKCMDLFLGPHLLQGAASGAAGFFRQQAAAATHAHWQLIQLAGTSTPGIFKASFTT
jgi:hypothetical protein